MKTRSRKYGEVGLGALSAVYAAYIPRISPNPLLMPEFVNYRPPMIRVARP